jgi:hypothetical protein
VNPTGRWLWGVLRNPDVVWVDLQTKEEIRERWRRRDRFQIFRPRWIRDAFTTRQSCGCRRRFGLWRTTWCSDHFGRALGKGE